MVTAAGDLCLATSQRSIPTTPTMLAVYDVNTIANYDPKIIRYLERPVGSAFERETMEGEFSQVFDFDSDGGVTRSETAESQETKSTGDCVMILGVVAITGVVVVILFVLICEQRDRESFTKSWPPISDEEFMAACPPGTDRFIALKVRRIVSEQLGFDYSRLHPAMRFVEDLGAD